MNQQSANLAGGIANGISDTANFIGTPFRWLSAQMRDSFPTGATSSGQLTFNPHAGDPIMNAPRSPFNIGDRNSIAHKAGYYGWPLLFPPAGDEGAADDMAGSLTGSALARSGMNAEERVAQNIGLPRNVGPGRVTIPGSGPGGFRVPDFNPAQTVATRGTVVEVKNTAQLTASSQLRDLVSYAQGQGVPLEIFTNANLPGSGELYNWIQSGQVIIRPIP